MSNDFSYLRDLEVRDKTARCTIYQVKGEPVLIVRPATEANKPYFNAVLRRTRRNVRAVQAGAVSAAMIAENRAEDRELFPKFVVSGWEGVRDGSGQDVPFSEDACACFIEALPDWLFDEVRGFAGNSANFTGGDVIDAEGRAKN
jgi:hypothetical protein